MASARNTDFTLLDYSEEVNMIPRVWTLIDSMNMFDPMNIESTVAQVERIQEISSLIAARARGGERNYTGSENAMTVNFNVPFFPCDRGITSQDIQNFRKYGEGNAPKTLQDQVTRVMERCRRNQALTKERVMVEAIKGNSYLGTGGVGTLYNYYTAFGETQATADVDFTSSVDPSATIETSARLPIASAAQDEAGGYEIVALCGTTWFSAFIAHAKVREAYSQYSSQQELLRERQGGNSIYREFTHKNVRYIEYPENTSVPAGEAFIFPMGIAEMFRIYYGPADDAMMANELGQELYLWYKEDQFNRQYKVESESSMLAVNTRPELVYKSTGTFS